jgi:hypothetical protein
MPEARALVGKFRHALGPPLPAGPAQVYPCASRIRIREHMHFGLWNMEYRCN